VLKVNPGKKRTPFRLKTGASVKGDIMFRSAGEKMGKGNSVTIERISI